MHEAIEIKIRDNIMNILTDDMIEHLKICKAPLTLKSEQDRLRRLTIILFNIYAKYYKESKD